MALTNNKKEFGMLTKLLHWTIFVLFVVQYALIYRRDYFPKNAPEKTQYILIHKSLGLLVLFLALMMIGWRQLGNRPAMPLNMNGFEQLLAKLTHFLLYLSMLIMPLTGIGMSLYAGYGVSFFGQFTIPALPKNEMLSDSFYAVHQWSSYVIIGLVSLHILGALYHHYYKKDGVLKRMSF
jgi:cytochrome b561